MVLGITCHWNARHDAAIAKFHRALEMNPRNFLAHVSIGHAYALAGEPGTVVCFLEKGLQLHPQDPWNPMNFEFMARAHLAAGDTKLPRVGGHL